MTKAALSPTGLTILRVVTGLVFLAHGWQKHTRFTIPGTQEAFADMGIPMASIAAPVVAPLELIGGIALIAGLLTKIFAALLAVNALGALVSVHASAGFFVADS